MPMSFNQFLDWWLSPISGISEHHIETWVSWHARTMVAAWAILLPLGVLAARYFKVTPKQDWPRQVDNRAWWHAHRTFQYGGSLFMLIGVWLIWERSTQTSLLAQWHAYLGWTVVALACVQILGGIFRGSKGGPTEPQMRGDHYDMTTWRLWFETIHKTAGWSAVLLSVLTICLGLVISDAPRWMPLVLAVWWVGLFLVALRLEQAGRCIDTYQAIWGPDLKHPGNRRPKVGWGARRRIEKEKKI
jgi:hypothetical protein